MLYSQERDEIHKKKKKNELVSWFLVHANEGYSQGASGILGLIAGDERDLHYLTRMALLSRSFVWHAKLGGFYDHLTILLQSLNV